MLPYIDIRVSVYGIAVFSGIFAAVIIYLTRSLKYGYNIRIIAVVSAFACSGTLLGSKLLSFTVNLILSGGSVSAAAAVNGFINSGYVFYGGLFGALAFSALTAKLLAIDRETLWSFLAPGFSAFHAVGRVGCFFGGCCYGVPWEYGIAMARDPEIKRFPVQLLECGVELCICLILLVYERKHFEKFKLMRIYLIVYSAARFFIEFLRGDAVRGIWFGFSTSQYIAAATILICTIKVLKEKMTNSSRT